VGAEQDDALRLEGSCNGGAVTLDILHGNHGWSECRKAGRSNEILAGNVGEKRKRVEGLKVESLKVEEKRESFALGMCGSDSLTFDF
jgi:hypothetical protein